MEMNGTWKNKNSGKFIKLTRSEFSDYVQVEYGDDFEHSENILFCLSNSLNDPIHISDSKFFTSNKIVVLAPDKFRNGEEIFERDYDQ